MPVQDDLCWGLVVLLRKLNHKRVFKCVVTLQVACFAWVTTRSNRGVAGDVHTHLLKELNSGCLLEVSMDLDLIHRWPNLTVGEDVKITGHSTIAYTN